MLYLDTDSWFQYYRPKMALHRVKWCSAPLDDSWLFFLVFFSGFISILTSVGLVTSSITWIAFSELRMSQLIA